MGYLSAFADEITTRVKLKKENKNFFITKSPVNILAYIFNKDILNI
jgi:hypothetical protein